MPSDHMITGNQIEYLEAVKYSKGDSMDYIAEIWSLSM